MRTSVSRTNLGMTGVALATVLIVGACSANETDAESITESESTTSTGTSLMVTVNNTVNGEERSDEWTVTCDPEGGTHPEPRQVCQFLELSAKWAKDPFAPTGDDMVCAQVYGGPETATVTGTWNGNPVDAKLDRTDGCEIARWSTALPILVVQGTPIDESQPS